MVRIVSVVGLLCYPMRAAEMAFSVYAFGSFGAKTQHLFFLAGHGNEMRYAFLGGALAGCAALFRQALPAPPEAGRCLTGRQTRC